MTTLRLHLVDDRMGLVNDYTEVDPDYGTRLGRVLREHGIESNLMPYALLSDDSERRASTGHLKIGSASAPQ